MVRDGRRAFVAAFISALAGLVVHGGILPASWRKRRVEPGSRAVLEKVREAKVRPARGSVPRRG